MTKARATAITASGTPEPTGAWRDAERLPWTELQAERASNPRKFRLVYAQEDIDPAGSLIDSAWIEGGEDRDGVLAPGCYDLDRGFMQWPAGVSGLLDYVTVDPSAGAFWGVEWWAIQPESKVRYLIRGLPSSRFKAGDLLQWDTSRGDLSGLMQEWQAESTRLGHPIRCWIIEGSFGTASYRLYTSGGWQQPRTTWPVAPEPRGLSSGPGFGACVGEPLP